jgi:hypothetical protein
MFEDGPKLPLRVRLTLLWRTGMLRAPLLRLLGGIGLLIGGSLAFALLQGDLACCGVGVGGAAALAGVLLLSIGLYEVVAVLLWSD